MPGNLSVCFLYDGVGVKKIINSLVLTGLGVSSPLCLAVHNHRPPYVGAEIIQTNQNYYEGYGRGIIAKNLKNYNFFGGVNLYKHFGLEVGYTFQPQKNKKTTLAYKQKFIDNEEVQSVNGGTSSSYISGTYPYLGFFANKQFGKINLKAMAGVSFARVNIQLAYKDNDVDAVRSLGYSTSKVVPMLKIISEYDLYKNIGIRLSLNYNKFSRFSIKPKFNNEVVIKLKDQVGVGLGFIYSFF